MPWSASTKMFSWPDSDLLTSFHHPCYFQSSGESLQGSLALQTVAISARAVLSVADLVQGCLCDSKNFGWLCSLCFDLACQIDAELDVMREEGRQHWCLICSPYDLVGSCWEKVRLTLVPELCPEAVAPHSVLITSLSPSSRRRMKWSRVCS